MSNTIATLRRERDELVEANRQLTDALAPPPRPFPANWQLTRTEALVLTAMMDARGISHDRFAMMDTGTEDPARALNVHACRIRRKTPNWVVVKTEWGYGYTLDDETRRKMRA